MNPAIPLNATGSRRLLSRVRDLMAGGGNAEERLDAIVRIIAADLVAEVCSVYIKRAGEVLELFATQGLNREAIHLTRLRVGEGLIGLIAAKGRPLALADARSHPGFVYRPETGEDIFHSLMGVPIRRSGRVLGVLAIQNRTQRTYTEEEQETLETVSMVMAELVASGELIDRQEMLQADGNATLPMRLPGIRLNGGLAAGEAVSHRPRIVVQRLVAEDVDVEIERLETAISAMRVGLERMFKASDLRGRGELGEVMETYRMLAGDAGWIARISDMIRKAGLSAEGAVQRVQTQMRDRMQAVADPYLRERLSDLEDVGNRLMQHLTGEVSAALRKDLPDRFILVARDLGPADLLEYDRSKMAGVVLEAGSPVSHVAIIARALDLPMVGRLETGVAIIDPGDPVIVDADNSQVFVRPGEDVQAAFRTNMALREQKRVEYEGLRNEPACSRDGVSVELNVNAGLQADVGQLDSAGAEGIGLYRTEIAFMSRPRLPGVGEQVELYKRIIELAGDKSVVFRTLDVGGDKILPYWKGQKEENPAMGWRSIRIGLDRPGLLRHQLRALLRAAAGSTLRIMFPMVAEVTELDAARNILEIEMSRARRMQHELPSHVEVGAMLEVPSLAFQLDALLPRVDFLSVGSNDLLQFFFAFDRGNARLSERYDPLSPAALSLLKMIIDKCDSAGVRCTLCGEMGGAPIDAMALIALGYRSLSMSPPSIGPVKAMVRQLSVARTRAFLTPLLSSPDHSLREQLRAFAADHGVAV